MLQEKHSIHQWLKRSVAILTFTGLCLIPPILNGYPFVTGDTGSYIRHAFDFQIPADRSPFYGVFLGFSSLWSSLWMTIIIQNLILSVIFFRYFRLITGSSSLKLFLPVALLTAFCTCVGWVSGFIMPDIFTAILILSTVLYLFDTPRTKWLTIFYLLLIFISLVVHNSHYIIFLLFCFTLSLITFFGPAIRKARNAIYSLIVTGIVSILLICCLNYSKGFGFTISAGSHVFMMAKMAESGILKQYLERNCSRQAFKLCAYKSEIPSNFNEFLWAGHSPLYKTGGWDSSKTEYSFILKEIFSNSTYRAHLAKRSAISTLKQMADVQLEHRIQPLGEGTSPWLYINKHMGSELTNYAKSVQTNNGFDTGLWPDLHMWAFFMSCLLVIPSFPRKELRQIRYIYLTIGLFYIVNAFVTSGVSTVTNRFQDRIFWIIPATNFITFSYHVLYKKHMRFPSIGLSNKN